MASKRKERELAHDEPSESRREAPNPPLVFRPRDPSANDMESDLALDQAGQIHYELSHPLVHRPKELSNDHPESETSQSQHPPNEGLEPSSGHDELMEPKTTQPASRTLRWYLRGLQKKPNIFELTLNKSTIGSLTQWMKIDASVSMLVTPTRPLKINSVLLKHAVIFDDVDLITSNYQLSGDPDYDVIITQKPWYKLKEPQRSSEPSSNIYSKKDTVSKLACLQDSEKIVLLRGPPASGKATLLSLLKQHLRQQS